MISAGKGPLRLCRKYLFGEKLAEALDLSHKADRALHADEDVLSWFNRCRSESCLKVSFSGLSSIDDWFIEAATGNIRHRSGHFFSITGVSIKHRVGTREICWDQPYIEQPEVGILGLATKFINGVLHFCVQAKEEPGNPGGVQLSPTVQATFSNYTQAHGGSRPLFLDYFIDTPPERILFAKLQTEDGGRFLYKSNRNMIILLPDHEMGSVPPNFMWLTLRQLGLLLRLDNCVHATTRSVLSMLLGVISFQIKRKGTSLSLPAEIQSTDLMSVLQWIDDQKTRNYFWVKREGLNILKEWHVNHEGYLVHEENRFFKIVGIDVSSPTREVAGWSQPIVVTPGRGVIGLLIKVQGGQCFCLMQAKPEPGNRSLIQVGPTVQFNPSNYIGNHKIAEPFLFNEFCSGKSFVDLSDSLQSEEGARFFNETHRHIIKLLPNDHDLQIPSEYRWMSIDELAFLMNMGEQVNSCARSVLSCFMSL